MPSVTPTPRSTHTSDPLLAPFLLPTFDPTTYLNSVLPPSPLSLTDLSTRTQSHITQLSAQTSRLTTTLTLLTDDILRSGARLAYEVELLRGESLALHDALTERPLATAIAKFVPGGLADEADADAGTEGDVAPDDQKQNAETDAPTELQALTSLRTLHHIRSRLQLVTQTLSAALAWPLPPSVLASSLISVSAPAPETAERAGQEALAALRGEVEGLVEMGPEGVEKAERRVEELRELCGVWRGTAEEKARWRFVEGLGKGVAERRKEEEGKGALPPKRRSVEEEKEERNGGLEKRGAAGSGGPGFLRRLREEMYLD